MAKKHTDNVTDFRTASCALRVAPSKPFHEMNADEFAAWKYQNGIMFLERLSYFKLMAPVIGEQRAADILLACRNDSELLEAWRAFRDPHWQRMADLARDRARESTP